MILKFHCNNILKYGLYAFIPLLNLQIHNKGWKNVNPIQRISPRGFYTENIIQTTMKCCILTCLIDIGFTTASLISCGHVEQIEQHEGTFRECGRPTSKGFLLLEEDLPDT